MLGEHLPIASSSTRLSMNRNRYCQWPLPQDSAEGVFAPACSATILTKLAAERRLEALFASRTMIWTGTRFRCSPNRRLSVGVSWV